MKLLEMMNDEWWNRLGLGASLFELRPHTSPSATTRQIAQSF